MKNVLAWSVVFAILSSACLQSTSNKNGSQDKTGTPVETEEGGGFIEEHGDAVVDVADRVAEEFGEPWSTIIKAGIGVAAGVFIGDRNRKRIENKKTRTN